MTRIDKVFQEYQKAIKDFGSPEHNMAERRKILRTLRDYEQEMDKYFQVHGEEEK